MAGKGAASWWLTGPERPQWAADAVPARAKVAVIGSGLTGASVAYHLALAGVDGVVVLERGPQPADGATGRNGGQILPTLTPAATTGGASAEMLRFEQDSIEETRRYAWSVAGGCDVEVSGTVWAGPDEDMVRDLLKCAPERARVLTRTELSNRIGTDAYVGAVLDPEGGQLYPAKVVRSLLDKARSCGTRVCVNAAVVEISPISGGSAIKLASGQTVAVEHVVHATNAFAAPLLPPAVGRALLPVRAQALCTKPLPQFTRHNIIISRRWAPENEVNKSSEYLIQRSDGRVILGGARDKGVNKEEHVMDTTTIRPNVSAHLHSFMHAFPAMRHAEIETEWTGIICNTPDEHPLVGSVPGRPGQLMAAGFNGHGMALAFRCGKAIAAWIATGSRPEFLPKSFAPDRFVGAAKM